MTSDYTAGIRNQTVYSILRKYALNKTTLSYAQLSEEYRAACGMWFEPHGSWDYPLGAVNNAVSAAGYPPITALVIRQDTQMPGDMFWGCAPNVPARPRNETARLVEWSRLTNEVFSAEWPPSMP